MRRILIGSAMVLHGLAHVANGTAAQDAASGFPLVVVTLAFSLALSGFVAAGFGVFGLAPLAARWPLLVRTAAGASLLLLALHPPSLAHALLGGSLDVGALILATQLTLPSARRSRRAAVIGVAAVTSLFGLALVRPWQRDWGSLPDERTRALPGDEHAGRPERAGDRAIEIHADARDVWPWLLQLGEDRGGFYSYAWLENVFALHIVNAERIEPRWQLLKPGDFVRAVPAGWLGGIFGERVGWEVDHVDPVQHVLGLRYWLFAVEATGPHTSRLHVRTHAGEPPLPIAPLLFVLFEPVHFVMERAMLIGIKERAERPKAE